jgi:4-carboxymuconolactone decarboxylase
MGEMPMSDPSKPGHEAFGDIAPALAEYTDNILFGEVWQRPGLSRRDRSLVTVSALIALYRTHELPIHLKKALENGVTREELIEAITHLAFYSGWPTAHSALLAARSVFANDRVQVEANTSCG